MFTNQFNIPNNDSLRIPQREGWVSIRNHYNANPTARFAGIVLPVGCGKSGLIAITPYAFDSQRTLVITPGTRIRDQLGNDMKSSSPDNFYQKCNILDHDANLPETVVVASGMVNHDDLENADIVVSNIHQIAGEENHWLDDFENDFFDLILVDEGHHNTAISWQQVFERFPDARVINFSATPARADGQLMEGEVIYSFPVVRAIQAGYVKRLTAKMLRPSELTYVDSNSGDERTVSLEEVVELGKEDAKFRRGIVMSEESLSSIVDCTIGELRRLREETDEQRLKIIASALHMDHCIQVVEAFSARGLRADYVHSRRQDQNANQRVFQRLENHEIDVIVQARMLGEGFDHKYLAVAMIGSIFANLSPFVQFVGRIMRVLEQNKPDSLLNRGVVVFHAGANVAQRWDDFRSFSVADQEYFAELLPEAENVDFDPTGPTEHEPSGIGRIQPVEVVSETGVSAADMDPIGDPEVAELLRQLVDRGITANQAAAGIRRIQPTRQDRRRALRNALNSRVQNETGGILNRCGINPGGRILDPRRQNTNYQWVVSELNKRVNASVAQEDANRENFTLEQLETASESLGTHVEALERELRDG